MAQAVPAFKQPSYRNVDIRDLGRSPSKSAWAPDGSTAAGLPGLRFEHLRQSVRLRIGRADTAQNLQTPRARVPTTFKALISDAFDFSRSTVSVVLRRLRLYLFADPATQPPRGFPPPPTRGLPPRLARSARVNPSTATRTRQHRGTAPVAKAPYADPQ